MSNLFWLSEEHFEKIQLLLPDDVLGVPKVDACRVLSGIIHVIKRGMHWLDCPAEYGPAKAIYNRYAQWGEKGVFALIFAVLVGEAGASNSLAIDSTRIKVHQTAGSGRKKDLNRGMRNSRGGRNSKVHAVTDAKGRPVVLVLTAGNVSDYLPAKECIAAALWTKAVIADRDYASDELRDFIRERGAKPVTPPKKNR